MPVVHCVLQHRPEATPAEVKAVLQHAAVAKVQSDDSSAPMLLLNVISPRLRAAGLSTRQPDE